MVLVLALALALPCHRPGGNVTWKLTSGVA